MSGHDRFADDVGAYLLGALEPGEVKRFEKHLKRCETCREELTRLEPARDALPASVEQFSPSPELKLSLMETVRAEAAERPEPSRAPAGRPRWRELLLSRPRLAAAAAAVVLAVGIAAGALVGGIGGDSATGQETLAATVDQNRMPAGEASLVIPAEADKEGGAILRVEGMQRPPAGHVYEVWIKHGDRVTPSSLFTVEHDGHGTAAIPHKLEGVDAVMVTREPEGGSRKPSERPVLMVALRS